MPIYEFSCVACARFEQQHALAAVPDVVACPDCGAPARRVLSAPHLSVAGSAAFRLIERTARSAAEPEVVDSTRPGRRAGRGPAVTEHPLHRKLPRP